MELSEIIYNKKAPLVARKLSHLIKIIQSLGWESFLDTDIIQPNLSMCKQYLIHNKVHIKKLFKIYPHTVTLDDIVNIINPFLIEFWHVQIVGSTDRAYLELLVSF